MSELEPAGFGYDVSASPVLGEFLASRNAIIEGLMGPFGSGKSVGATVKLAMLGHEIPPMRDGVRRSRFAVIRNTYKQLEDTTIKTVHQWFPPARFGHYQDHKKRYVIGNIKGIEIELLFRALDRPDHVQNLLSLELTGGWINEAREISRAVIGPLYGRFGRFPSRADVGPYRRRLLMDTNPPDTENWWYKEFEELRRRGWRLFRQPGGRSPHAENIDNLPDGYYDDMVLTMSEDEVKVYVDAQYGYLQTGKPVYPEYRDDWHCAEFDVGRWPILRCWDFGLTPACIYLQVAPSGQVRVFDELCAERAGIMSFAPLVNQHTRTRYAWAKDSLLRDIGDPAGDTPSQTDENTCYAIMRGQGIDIEPGVQDVVLRTESVRSLLTTAIDGQPGLLLHPRCKKLRKGFAGEYKYRRLLVGGNNPRYALAPEKNEYSHPHDALQYGCVDLVGDRVQGYGRRPGDRVQVASIAEFDPMQHAFIDADVQFEQAFADSNFDPMR